MVSLNGSSMKGGGGGLISESGWYLAKATSAETTNDYGTQVELSVKVMGIGADVSEEQLGRESRIWISTQPSDRSRDPEKAQAAITSKLVNLAYSMGIIDLTTLDGVKNGSDAEIDFNVAEPKDVYLKISAWENSNGKTRLDIRESRPVCDSVSPPPIVKLDSQPAEVATVSNDDAW